MNNATLAWFRQKAYRTVSAQGRLPLLFDVEVKDNVTGGDERAEEYA